MSHKTEASASSPSKRMSNRQYAHAQGLRCPFCRASDVEGTGGVEIDAGIATQEVRCNTCDQQWTDIYRLIGYQTESA